MKKSNFVTFLLICLIIISLGLFIFSRENPSQSSDEKSEVGSQTSEITESTPDNVESDISSNENTEASSQTSEDDKTVSQASENDELTSENGESISSSFETSQISETNNTSSESVSSKSENKVSANKALFIGDSRTVGLMEYAGIKNADFFCTVGMSVYNIHKKPVSVPSVGKVTLTELVKGKKYDNIYIMLGINEVGYKFSSTAAKYKELIELIEKNQPDSNIFIQANLHVSKTKSDRDKVVNNKAINGLNSQLSKLADGKTKFYLDANPEFDDENGGLSADKSGDGVHLYAKYYKERGEWIIRQSASLSKEE